VNPQRDKPSEGVAHGTVQTLSRMIKDLEGQLDRMIAINEALEEDLDQERARGSKLERKVHDLMQKLQRAEQESVGKEDLQAQVAYLNGERSRLARKVEELTQSLDTAERANRKNDQVAKRLRAGRADALEELRSIEAQFERAMKVVSDLKTRVSVLGEDYEALRLRLKASEDNRRHAEDERDALLAEVDESRTALEDIRRSLVDACVVSQQRLDD
jgi:chromosome segregation ATPase